MRITRRTLIRGAVTLGSGLALGQLPALVRQRTAEASARVEPGERPAVLYDLTRCAGCHLCEVACQTNKGLPPDKSVISFRTADPESTATKGPWAVRRHQCLHCISPACVSVCPVAAMQKTPEGPVIYADDRCFGCRYCMNACPFGVPTFDWDSGLLDQALIRKCDFCYDRQSEGKQPACIDACPTGAVTFGKRDQMLATARTLIQEHPGRYVNHIYGETEAGGTSFLMIAGVPFEKLGLPQPGSKALTELPETIMAGVVPFALAWGLLLTGVTAVARLKARKEDRS